MTLENVRLKVEAFEYLQLPITITEGCIGRLVVQARHNASSLGVSHTSLMSCKTSESDRHACLVRTAAMKRAHADTLSSAYATAAHARN